MEIADMLGVSKARVNQMATGDGYEGSFPTSAAHLKAGRIWRRADVVQWAKRNRVKLRK